MKFMISTHGSQQDDDGLAATPGAGEAWSREDFVALATFMHRFNADLAQSRELVKTRG